MRTTKVRFPQEVVENIVRFIPFGERIAGLATLSPEWQAAVERRTFRCLTISSQDLEGFASVLHSATVGRLSPIKFLRMTILVPECCKEARYEYETDDDRRSSNRIACEHVSSLLKILSDVKWPPDAKLSLDTHFGSPTSGSFPNFFSYSNHSQQPRHNYSYLTLEGHEYSVPRSSRTGTIRTGARLSILSGAPSRNYVSTPTLPLPLGNGFSKADTGTYCTMRAATFPYRSIRRARCLQATAARYQRTWKQRSIIQNRWNHVSTKPSGLLTCISFGGHRGMKSFSLSWLHFPGVWRRCLR